MAPWVLWKLVLAIALVAAIVLSQFAHAPSRAVARVELRRLVLAAVGLYVVGGIASLTRHPHVAAVVYAGGIATCALAAWLSRGSDSGGPPGGERPTDEQPPPDPDGLSGFDWARFEADFRAFTERERSGVS